MHPPPPDYKWIIFTERKSKHKLMIIHKHSFLSLEQVQLKAAQILKMVKMSNNVHENTWDGI